MTVELTRAELLEFDGKREATADMRLLLQELAHNPPDAVLLVLKRGLDVQVRGVGQVSDLLAMQDLLPDVLAQAAEQTRAAMLGKHNA